MKPRNASASMRLALYETGFLFSTALRANGFPYGALQSAVRMVQWAEIFHGVGLRFLDRQRRAVHGHDPKAIRIVADGPTGAAIDGGGQSALLLGPGALDLATAKADRNGIGVVTVTNLRDHLWLGQLAEQAAKRSLLCCLAFQAMPESAEAADLRVLYSPGRSIVAIPDGPAPHWIELTSASVAHDRLLRDGPDAPTDKLLQDVLAPADAPLPGFSMMLQRLDATVLAETRELLLDAASRVGATVLDPEAVAALHKRALRDGFDVDPDDYYPLARYGLTTVIPSTEDSRAQAGADG